MKPLAYRSVLFLSILVGACKSTGNHDSGVKSLIDEKIILWPDRTVAVCWAPHEYGDQTSLQDYLKDNVTREFARAGIRVTGWELCKGPTLDPGPYPITLGNSDNFTLGTGYNARLDGVNLDIVNDPYPIAKFLCKPEGAQFLRRECILHYAVHEMGHFVGLEHEHERLDAWDKCLESGYRKFGYRSNFGDFDEQSIMNYCVDQEFWMGSATDLPLHLSDTDVATLKTLYDQTAAFLQPSERESSSPFIDADELVVKVSGLNLSDYSFQILKSEKQEPLKCKSELYSAFIPINDPIHVDLKEQTGGVIKVCVLGRNKDGRSQNPMAYSSVTYIVDRTPTAIIEGEEEVTSVTPPLKVSGKDIKKYIFKVVSSDKRKADRSTKAKAFLGSNPCLEESGYSSPKDVSETISVNQLKEAGSYMACVRGIDKAGQMQSLIKSTKFPFEVAE